PPVPSRIVPPVMTRSTLTLSSERDAEKQGEDGSAPIFPWDVRPLRVHPCPIRCRRNASVAARSTASVRSSSTTPYPSRPAPGRPPPVPTAPGARLRVAPQRCAPAAAARLPVVQPAARRHRPRDHHAHPLLRAVGVPQHVDRPPPLAAAGQPIGRVVPAV